MIKEVINNRKIVFFLLICLAIFGGYSYTLLPKQEAPDMKMAMASISTVYPGASIEDVENYLTKKIEEKINTMENVDYVQTRSYYSYSNVLVVFDYGTDYDEVIDELKDKLDELREDLPEGVLPYDINAELAKTAGIIISLSSDEYDYDMLDYYGEKVIERLEKIEGITSFETMGAIDKEVVIELDYKKINRLGVSYNEIINVLKMQNLEIPSGEVDLNNEKVPFYMKGSFESIEDIENVVIGGSQEKAIPLMLKNVATVSFREQENQKVYRKNGDKSILLVGYFEENKNILPIGDDVRKEIDKIKSELPDGLDFGEVIYQPEEVSGAIGSFIWNLLLGVLLVIVVVFLGMGIRNAIIVSLAIPSSILFTISLMPILDIKIHTITIAAFIVALGMLVDNAIVVSDNIQLKLDAGEDKMSACFHGTKEVVIPILTSTLTTIGAFMPLILLSSLAGDYLQALPKVVMLSLTASFLFSFLVTPSLAFIFFKKHKHRKTPEQTFMTKLLAICLKKKGLFIAVFIVIVAVFGSLILFINITFFPKADKNIMYIDIVADKNISTSYTKEISDSIEKVLENEEGVLNYTTAIGGAVPKFYTTVSIYPDIPENAQILIEIDLAKTNFTKNTDFAKYLQNKIDSVVKNGNATVLELEIAEPLVSPILIRILGSNDRISEIAKQMEDAMDKVEGARNVRTDISPRTYNYDFDLDAARISYLGLSKYDVLNEVSIALLGRDASMLRKDGKEYNIKVKSDLENVEEIQNMRIKSTLTKRKYLLKDLGSLRYKDYDKVIRKFNGKEEIRLLADLKNGYDSATVEAEFAKYMQDIDTSGAEIKYDGENQKIAFYFGNLGVSAVLAIFIIFTILLIQFKNFKNALIIFITLPLSTAGAMVGLFIFNQPLSFTAMVGLISLIGIVVNNAIVLMEFMEVKRREGLDIDEVAVMASLFRFRPIMLSTITTCIGLLPLVFSSSELFKPLSISLASGLLLSTFLTLVFIPLVYALVYRKNKSNLVNSQALF